MSKLDHFLHLLIFMTGFVPLLVMGMPVLAAIAIALLPFVIMEGAILVLFALTPVPGQYIR